MERRVRIRHETVLIIASAVCFVVATLIAMGIIDSVRFDAWLSGGFLAFVLAHIKFD